MTTDWTAFGEAYAAIPALLEHLRGKKKQARNYARNKVVDLCGPAAGSTDPAAAVLPLLVELLTDPEVPEREGLLLVLADLAAGGLHPDALVPGWTPSGLAAELNALVAANADALVPLLDDEKAAVRAAAALPLALVGRRQALTARASMEKNATARGAMLVGLGLLGDRAACEAGLEDEKAAVRFGAACGLLLAGDPPHDGALSIVVEDILDGTGVPGSFPWCGGNTAGMGVELLTRACLAHDDASPLERLFPDGSNPPLAAMLVRIAFPDRAQRTPDPAVFTGGQRGVLRVVSRSKTSVDATASALASRGLPRHQPSLARYAGATPPGPLDRRVAGRPLWLALWEVIHAGADVEALWAALPDDTDVRALVLDACGPYMGLQQPQPPPPPGSRRPGSIGRARLTSALAGLLVQRMDAAAVEAWMAEVALAPKAHPWALSDVLLRAWEAMVHPDGAAIAGKALPLWTNALDDATVDILRPLAERLAPETRASLVLGEKVFFHHNRFDGAWIFDGILPYLDLVRTAEAAEVAVGVATGPKPPPLERIREVLLAIGPAALPAIDGALGEEARSEDRLAMLRAARAELLEQ